MAEQITTIRLPNLATRKPATGREVSNPTGRQNRIPPSAALFTCNFAWISGMREAQEKKQIPARKKKLLTAIRCTRRWAKGIKNSKLLIKQIAIRNKYIDQGPPNSFLSEVWILELLFSLDQIPLKPALPRHMHLKFHRKH